MCVPVLIYIVVSVIVEEVCTAAAERGCEQQEKASQSAEQQNVLTGLQEQLSCRPCDWLLRRSDQPLLRRWLPGRLRRLGNAAQQRLKSPLPPSWKQRSGGQTDVETTKLASAQTQTWNRRDRRRLVFRNVKSAETNLPWNVAPVALLLFIESIIACGEGDICFSCVCVCVLRLYFQQNWEEEKHWKEGYWTCLSVNRGRGESQILKASVFVWSPEWFYCTCCMLCVHLSFFSAYKAAVSSK